MKPRSMSYDEDAIKMRMMGIMESCAILSGAEEGKPGDVKRPVQVAKPFKIQEKMRHSMRLDSDDQLERHKGLFKDKEDEFRSIFKLPVIKDVSKTL